MSDRDAGGKAPELVVWERVGVAATAVLVIAILLAVVQSARREAARTGQGEGVLRGTRGLQGLSSQSLRFVGRFLP